MSVGKKYRGLDGGYTGIHRDFIERYKDLCFFFVGVYLGL